MRFGLWFAGALHLIMAAFEPLKFNFFSACTVLFMAEAKLRLHFQYELIPPVYPSVNIFAAPVYCMNWFIWGWEHRWKYTDKVWRSLDIAFPIVNTAIALYLWYIYNILPSQNAETLADAQRI